MTTKIKLNSALINYQKLRQQFYDRVFNNGGTYEGDDNLVEILNKENTQDLKLLLTPTALKTGTAYSVLSNISGADFSFTQNTANGVRTNKYNTLEILGVNTPRFTWENNIPLILVEEEATNLNPYSQDVNNYSGGDIANFTVVDFVSGGYKNLPYQNITKDQNALLFETYTATSDRLTARYYLKNITDIFQGLVFNETTGSIIANFRVDDNFDVLIDIGNNSIADTGDNGWHEMLVSIDSGISPGDVIRWYVGVGSALSVGASFDLCQIDVREEYNAIPKMNSPIITTGSSEIRNDDIYTVTPPVGTTEIQEHLSNGTVNTITTIPATYTPTPGLYKYILMK